MFMKKNILIAFLLLLANQYGTAQLIDKYGLSIGTTYSNQLWNYKLFSIENPNKDYKTGLSFFLSAEKEINKALSIRSELGYLQKGFKNNLELSLGDGITMGVRGKNVIFHDLGLNIELKILPFKSKLLPYALIGFRGDYMLSYKDIVFEEQGSGLRLNMYESQINEFNKLNLGGLIGIGLEFNDLYYLEFEYNPAITSSFNSDVLQIKDNCWDLKLGLYINKLIKITKHERTTANYKPGFGASLAGN